MITNVMPENCRSWEELQDELFGAPGTPQREQLEKESEIFRIKENKQNSTS
jgi:HTH-type transcriptional regulator / antitoxin HipB